MGKRHVSRRIRRNEYEHALNLARKARRRGDILAADRWLKHADLYLAIDGRLFAAADKLIRRNAEFAGKRAQKNEKQYFQERVRVLHELEEELDWIDDLPEGGDEIAEEKTDECPPDKSWSS